MEGHNRESSPTSPIQTHRRWSTILGSTPLRTPSLAPMITNTKLSLSDKVHKFIAQTKEPKGMNVNSPIGMNVRLFNEYQ